MSRVCEVCSHDKRLDIDREIVQGKPKSKIALKFGVPAHSVSYHAENHISRQLAKSFERKSISESMDLMGRIDSIIDRAEKIFSRNFDRDTTTGDLTALRALGEQRSTIELLAKISAYLHESRLLELQAGQDALRQEQQAQDKERMKRLNFEELKLYLFLVQKMNGQEVEAHMIPDIFKEPAPSPALDPVIEATPAPIPEPQAPQATKPPRMPVKYITENEVSANVSNGLPEESAPDGGQLSPGCKADAGQLGEGKEPERRGLPAAPVKTIPGDPRRSRVNRRLLGRRIAETMDQRSVGGRTCPVVGGIYDPPGEE